MTSLSAACVCVLCSEHHANDVSKLNDALLKHPKLQTLDLVTLNKHAGTGKIPDNIALVIRNHGAPTCT